MNVDQCGVCAPHRVDDRTTYVLNRCRAEGSHSLRVVHAVGGRHHHSSADQGRSAGAETGPALVLVVGSDVELPRELVLSGHDAADDLEAPRAPRQLALQRRVVQLPASGRNRGTALFAELLVP